jgi:hypothetical protein
MNEQIRQLAEQARKKPMGDSWCYTSPKEFEQKLAELVIQQCASQVRFTDLLLCNDDSDGEILLQASVQLKRHFGVE